MSKDPAFLFYHQDFFTGVSDMSNEEVGAYVRCLCVQASKGGITEKHMINICNSSDIHNEIKNKFNFNSETNLFENKRLKEEIEKRRKYSESRSNNRKNKSKDDNLTNNISKSYVNHMEIEDEIEIEGKKEKEDLIEIKKNEKIDFDEILTIFNSVCVGLPKIQKITKSRIASLNLRIKEYGLLSLGEVFKKVSESRFLNGENDRGWTADFDWILNPNNFQKIIEDKYKNKENGTESKSKSNQQIFDEAMQSDIGRNFRFK